jgi:hypothetical protein
MKLTNTKSNKVLVPLHPGTAVTNIPGAGYSFDARFAVPYRELASPMKITFTDHTGKQGSLEVASLASLNYMQVASTLDDLDHDHIKPDRSQLNQLDLCFKADPSIDPNSIYTKYPPMQQTVTPPLGSSIARKPLLKGEDTGWRTLPDGRHIKLEE